MARLAALLLVVAACTTSVQAPPPAAPAPGPVAARAEEAPAELPPPAEVPPPADLPPRDREPRGGFGYGGVGQVGDVPFGRFVELAPAPAPPPAIPREEIRRVVASHRAAFAHCYETELVKEPALRGRVETSFVIGADGTVVSARVTGLGPAVEACMVAALRAMRFPKPTTGGDVIVTYPFHFASAGTPP